MGGDIKLAWLDLAWSSGDAFQTAVLIYPIIGTK